MYIFFINDRPFVITNSTVGHPEYAHLSHTPYLGEETLMDLVRKTEEPQQEGLVVVADDPTAVFLSLKSHFTTIHAGGGIVFNSHGDLLLMKRLGKWDLPKGKIDPGETVEEGALREVEEECGITELKLEKFFGNSYHTYKLQGHRFLKITHWYVMGTHFKGNLIPQAEENITDVKWVNFGSLNLVELDTYESIREILKQVKKIRG